MAIVITSYLLPGIHVSSFMAALVTAVVLGILNAIMRPILILLTLPINILSLGLFTLVINAFVILIASLLVSGFTVDGFWWALLFSIILSIVNGFLYKL
jgi:putative membrane protein